MAPRLQTKFLTLPLLHVLLLLACGGCLVPLKLDADNAVEDGRVLMINAGTPPFGTKVATEDESIDFILDVESDRKNLAGRLYVQVDGRCCDLDLVDAQDPQKIHVLSETAQITTVGEGQHRVSFERTRPCYHVGPMAPAYVIPVVAIGGFVGGPTGKLEAVGPMNKNHMWVVQCQ